MSEPEYSNDAMNVLAVFYEKDIVVYVEGEEDIPFWDTIFSKCTKIDPEIISVGGSEELDKIIAKIENEEIVSIAARDADFLHLSNDKFKSSNIILTYGHSIENTLICEKSVPEIIAAYAKCSGKTIGSKAYTEWHEGFMDGIKELIIADIYNAETGKGIAVLGDNCTKFMESQTSEIICRIRVNSHMGKLGLADEIDSEKLTKAIEKSNRIISDYLRGHFLFSAALKFANSKLRELSRGKSIPKESFYGALLLAFKSIFNSSHPHYEHYSSQLKKVSIV